MKSELTKQRIIEHSLELFVKNGYGSTTIRSLAKELNISTGLLFHYFPSKQALLETHLKIAMGGLRSALEILEQESSPIQAFDSIAKLTLEALEKSIPRNLYVLMNQPIRKEFLPKDFIKIRQQLLTKSADMIKLGQADGQIKQGDPLELALIFWGTIQGAAQILASQPELPVPSRDLIVNILKD
ncbi:MAG TPA: TetR/AcrR family transcriptional regulator [Candidatus Saccharimonadales bacterium]|nr:TetR/AcrR family transcriptional regulator [Candidatus Saccharimonadales bacterium]